MTAKPGVSVVIPTHDRPELMRRALVSVVEQEYDGDVEVVVVFDACDVHDPQVPTGEGREVRLVPNRRSRGLAGARNTGILEARHGLVAFLDDDDHWLPGKLAAQVAVMQAEPETVLVGSAMVVDDGQRTFDRLVPLDTVRHEDLLRDRMAGLHSSTFLFRRDALVGPLGMVDEDLPGSYGEDYDILLRTSLLAPVRIVNEPLVSVRWSGQSYFFGKWAAYADGLSYLYERHPGFRADRKANGRLCSQIAFARAAAGERTAARTWCVRSLRADPLQVKAWLALAISMRLVSADRVVRVVQRMGKGI